VKEESGGAEVAGVRGSSGSGVQVKEEPGTVTVKLEHDRPGVAQKKGGWVRGSNGSGVQVEKEPGKVTVKLEHDGPGVAQTKGGCGNKGGRCKGAGGGKALCFCADELEWLSMGSELGKYKCNKCGVELSGSGMDKHLREVEGVKVSMTKWMLTMDVNYKRHYKVLGTFFSKQWDRHMEGKVDGEVGGQKRTLEGGGQGCQAVEVLDAEYSRLRDWTLNSIFGKGKWVRADGSGPGGHCGGSAKRTKGGSSGGQEVGGKCGRGVMEQVDLSGIGEAAATLAKDVPAGRANTPPKVTKLKLNKHAVEWKVERKTAPTGKKAKPLEWPLKKPEKRGLQVDLASFVLSLNAQDAGEGTVDYKERGCKYFFSLLEAVEEQDKGVVHNPAQIIYSIYQQELIDEILALPIVHKGHPWSRMMMTGLSGLLEFEETKCNGKDDHHREKACKQLLKNGARKKLKACNRYKKVLTFRKKTRDRVRLNKTLKLDVVKELLQDTMLDMQAISFMLNCKCVKEWGLDGVNWVFVMGCWLVALIFQVTCAGRPGEWMKITDEQVQEFLDQVAANYITCQEHKNEETCGEVGKYIPAALRFALKLWIRLQGRTTVNGSIWVQKSIKWADQLAKWTFVKGEQFNLSPEDSQTPSLMRKLASTRVCDNSVAEEQVNMVAVVNAHSSDMAGGLYNLNKPEQDAAKAKAILKVVYNGNEPAWPLEEESTQQMKDRLIQLHPYFARGRKPQQYIRKARRTMQANSGASGGGGPSVSAQADVNSGSAAGSGNGEGRVGVEAEAEDRDEVEVVESGAGEGHVGVEVEEEDSDDVVVVEGWEGDEVEDVGGDLVSDAGGSFWGASDDDIPSAMDIAAAQQAEGFRKEAEAAAGLHLQPTSHPDKNT